MPKLTRNKRFVAERTRVATNIRRLRKKAGWSQEKLGQRAKTHRTFISLIERGHCNPSLLALSHIAAALGIKTAQLLW